MKAKLIPEESQHLIDLGVPKEKASLILPTDSYEIEDISIINGVPIFKLEDFLNGEILPKEIETKDGDVCLDIQMMNETCCVSYEYIFSGGCIAYYEEKELIDALYKLACWYYGEFLKQNKQWNQD